MATVWQSSAPSSPDVNVLPDSSPPPASPFSAPTAPTAPTTPPPRPHTPVSRLPRCAVVNFRKDGTSLAWKPRLSQNVGGLAARVHNFEDAFSLEEFSSRALRAPHSLPLGRCQPPPYAASLAAATKLNVSHAASLKLAPQPQRVHAPHRAAARAARGARAPQGRRHSRGLRRSALSFFKRMLQRERGSAHVRADAPHTVVPQQRNAMSYHASSSSGACTPAARSEEARGSLSRRISDSTVTDESDQSGSPFMVKERAARFEEDDGRLRFEQKSKSVWKAGRNGLPAAAKRRVRSSLGGRPLPSLRRRMHKHSEMGAGGGGSNGSDDPYVRFITDVM